MGKKVSMRARRYVKNKVSGMSDYQAAVDAGYSHNTALNARKKVENGGVRELLDRAMEKHGLTADYLMNKVKEGIEQPVKKGVGKNNIASPDYATRHRYIETAFRIGGYDMVAKTHISVDNSRAVIVLPHEIKE